MILICHNFLCLKIFLLLIVNVFFVSFYFIFPKFAQFKVFLNSSVLVIENWSSLSMFYFHANFCHMKRKQLARVLYRIIFCIITEDYFLLLAVTFYYLSSGPNFHVNK